MWSIGANITDWSVWNKCHWKLSSFLCKFNKISASPCPHFRKKNRINKYAEWFTDICIFTCSRSEGILIDYVYITDICNVPKKIDFRYWVQIIKIKFKHLFIYLIRLCLYVSVGYICGSQGQLLGTTCIFPLCSSWDQTMIIRFENKYLYPMLLIRLGDPKIDIYEISEMLLEYIFIILCLITIKMVPGSLLSTYSENKYVP